MKRILILFFFVFLIGLAEARDQSVSVDYSFLNDSLVEKFVEFPSVLLKVNTEKDAVCRYSLSEGRDYDNMEGNFDLTAGKLHEKSFTELGDGIYKYYVKCSDSNSSDPPELEVILRVSSLVSAQIVLSEEEPLKDGEIEVTVLTSKIISQTPSLSYSFDSLVYNPLVLFGSEKVWKGHLIIPKNLGESVVSFKFKANDLEGRQGEEITSGNAYLVDTVKPNTISNIKATGYEGGIKLEWYLDEDVEEFNIYRSSTPDIDYTNFFENTDEDFYYDDSAEKGKTYYYRVSALDEAGNEGDLSKQVYATSLIENGTSSGLSINLVGKVDNLITEIESVISEAGNIQTSILGKEGSEKELFSDLRLEKEISSSVTELEALKRDISNYKGQDLSELELEGKLNSARLRLNIIKKKIPENLVILEEESEILSIAEEDIEEAILELEEGISDERKQKSLEETLRIIEDSGLSVTSNFYVVEIVYLDGSRGDVSIVERNIAAELSREENTFFVEIIPKDVAESVSDIELGNMNYEVVKEDPVLSFSSDNKKIIYSFNKDVGLNSLRDIKFSFVHVSPEVTDQEITGYFVLTDRLSGGKYVGIFIGVFLLVAMFVYLVYIRKNKPSDEVMEIFKRINQASDCLNKGDFNKAKGTYASISEDYSKLASKDKKRVYGKVESLRNKIFEKIKEVKNGI